MLKKNKLANFRKNRSTNATAWGQRQSRSALFSVQGKVPPAHGM